MNSTYSEELVDRFVREVSDQEGPFDQDTIGRLAGDALGLVVVGLVRQLGRWWGQDDYERWRFIARDRAKAGQAEPALPGGDELTCWTYRMSAEEMLGMLSRGVSEWDVYAMLPLGETLEEVYESSYRARFMELWMRDEQAREAREARELAGIA